MTTSVNDLRVETRKTITVLVEQMKTLQAKIHAACDAAGAGYFDEKGEVSWDMVSDFCGQSVTDAIESVSSCLVEEEAEEEVEGNNEEVKVNLPQGDQGARWAAIFKKYGVNVKK